MGENEEKNFEALLKRLEEIVEKMDSGGLSLEEYLNLYQEGIKKADILTSMLTDSRSKVMKLVADKDGKPVLEPFDVDDDFKDKDEG
jgi:exodeoxyribonuclease VII small subunit